MRHNFDSALPDYKEASTWVDKHPKGAPDEGYESFVICCKDTYVCTINFHIKWNVPRDMDTNS